MPARGHFAVHSCLVRKRNGSRLVVTMDINVPQSIRLIRAGIIVGILGAIAGIIMYGTRTENNPYRLWWIVMFAAYLFLYVVCLAGINGRKIWAWKALLSMFSLGLLGAIYSFLRIVQYWDRASNTAIGFKVFNLVYFVGLFILSVLPRTKRYLGIGKSGSV